MNFQTALSIWPFKPVANSEKLLSGKVTVRQHNRSAHSYLWEWKRTEINILPVICGVEVAFKGPKIAVVGFNETLPVDMPENVDPVDSDNGLGDVDVLFNVKVGVLDKMLEGFVCAAVAEGITSDVIWEFVVWVDVAVRFCVEECGTVVNLFTMLTVDAICIGGFEFDTMADNVDVVNFVGVNTVVFVICWLQLLLQKSSWQHI